jgi:hypothetical protein
MNIANTKPKILGIYYAVEILVGLVVLASVLLNLFDFRLFIAIFGAFGLTFMLLGTALLSIGALRLGSTFLNGYTSLTKKVNTVTSVLTVMAAVMILFFSMIATEGLWFRFLFGIGLLSCGIGRITLGGLAREVNSGLRAFTALIGITIAVLSIIVISFPMVSIHPNVYLTYAYFVNIAFLLVGTDCLASAILSMFLQKN